MHLGLCVPIAVYQDMNGQHLDLDFRIITKLAMAFKVLK